MSGLVWLIFESHCNDQTSFEMRVHVPHWHCLYHIVERDRSDMRTNAESIDHFQHFFDLSNVRHQRALDNLFLEDNVKGIKRDRYCWEPNIYQSSSDPQCLDTPGDGGKTIGTTN